MTKMASHHALSRLGLKLRSKRLRHSLPKDIGAVVNRLTPDDTVLDIGAHVGVASAMFAASGCQVFAIEPNPHAFRNLQRLANGNPHIHPIWAAASVPGRSEVELYMHRYAAQNQVKYAQGSSLRPDKPNVGGLVETVPALDLASLIHEFGHVTILKMDIEGYEVDLLPWLASDGCLKLIENIFVETHENKWPSLVEATQQMRQKCELAVGQSRIFWNWP